MSSTPSLIRQASPRLIAAAARQPTWRAALRELGLTPTEGNVEAFRERAKLLDVAVDHLRFRRRFAEVSTQELELAVKDAPNCAAALEALDMPLGGKSYARLIQISACCVPTAMR